MKPMDHLEHLDKHLVDELAQVARETVRDELREQTRKQRRRATLYAASGALALYAGAALALAVGLALALGLPGWAAALITAVLLGAAAYVLRGMARPDRPGSGQGADAVPGREEAGRAGAAADGLAYPPVPPAPPHVPPRPTDAPDVPRPRA
ncbi:phage holin family protein [Streptomyces sp. NPDC056039]|uniref:phage holin family protein n=1 Tax=Streptomyces sp. NPDC056039 TaxID=3345687 RepID=UPI0035DC90C0